MIIDNCWYGHRGILVNYCGFKDQHIHAAIAHGQEIYVYTDRLYHPGKARGPILVWNKFEEANALRKGASHVISIGSPFLYLLRSYQQEKSIRSTQVGTICFPMHGVPGISVITDITKWRGKIMDNFPPPYAVSLPSFDPDFSFKKSQYEKLGFDVLSFGHRTDQNYLYRFIDGVSSYRYATSDDMGSTAILYSMALGLSVRHYSCQPIIDYTYCNYGRPSFIPKSIANHYNKSFLEGQDAKHVSNEVLGFDCILEPHKLAQIIGLLSLRRKALAMGISLATRLRYGFDTYENPADHKIQSVRGEVFDLSYISDLLNKNL